MPRDLQKIAAAIVLLAFTPFATAASCVKTGSRCVDSTPCKSISGVNVCLAGVALPAGGIGTEETCWDVEDTYNCASPQQVDDCQPLREKGCGQIGTQCLATGDQGSCTMYQNTFQCQTAPAQTKVVEDCGAKEFCMDGKCFDSSHAADGDIFKVATAMEAAREAGLYMDPDSFEMFKGYGSHCAKGYFGLKNCCKTSGGGAAMTNSGVLGKALGATLSAAADAAGEAVRYGSTYTYDALYQSDSTNMVTQGLGATLDLGGPATPIFNPTASFGMYGLTWTSGTMSATTMGLANIDLAAQTGVNGLYFSPAGLYIAVGMMILEDLMSCDPQDQILGVKRGQNLCHLAGSYCSQKMPILGICLETTESYCCFNSKLARIINEQGRPQIGKSWGTGESPNCSGFTPDQFQGLDFSKMDLSEFYAEIMANMKAPDVSQAAQKAQDTVTKKLNYYYGR